MKFAAEAPIRSAAQIVGIAIAWFALSKFNAWLFFDLEHTARANWIFLPAAFRPLIILLFGWHGAAGLVLGAYLTVHGTIGGDAFHEIMFAIILGVTPWIAVSMGKSMLGIPDSLAGLGAWQIIVLCTLCAGANALTLNGYLWALGSFDGGLIQILTIIVGDLLGAAIVLFVISSALAFGLPHRSRP